MPANNVTVTAQFRLPKFDRRTYTATVTNGVVTSPTVPGIYENQTVNITANPAPPGKAFEKWTSSDVTFLNANSASTSFTMPGKDVTVKANYIDRFPVKVNNGKGSGQYALSATVNITANDPVGNQQFKEWVVNSGGVTLANAKAFSTSFIMPARSVEVTATYSTLASGTYAITVQNNGYGVANASVNAAKKGAVITLTAKPNAGYQLKQWQVESGGVAIANSKFTMPDRAVIVKAVFEKLPAPTKAQLTYSLTAKAYTGKALGLKVTPKTGVGKVTALYYEGVNGTVFHRTKVKPIKLGSYKVTADLANGTKYRAVTNLSIGTFKINPMKNKVSTATSPSAKKMKVTWTRPSSKAQAIDKYQIRYRETGGKWKPIKSYAASKNTATITSLKSGKSYQVQVRSLKKISQTTYYSTWSPTKTSKKIR